MFDLRQAIQNRSKWFWIRSFGVLLSIAPSIVFMTVLVLETSGEESAPVAPFMEYLAIAMVALLVGYAFTRKGADEEERERIKTLIREVLTEQDKRFSYPPAPLKKEDLKSKVTQLPFMENE